jgi:hypothetical protein
VPCLFADIHSNVLNLKSLDEHGNTFNRHLPMTLKLPKINVENLVADNMASSPTTSTQNRCLPSDLIRYLDIDVSSDTPLISQPYFFDHENTTSPINHLRVRLFTKDLFNTKKFCELLSLNRWQPIEDLHSKGAIDWSATWHLFSYHQGLKKSATSFIHSKRISFSSKTMMDELPLLHNLQTARRPDLYDADWNCILCHKDKETWSHLWQCEQLKPLLTSLCNETKTAMEKWISEFSESPPSFSSEWNDLDCWKYPSPDSPSLNFDFLIKGFIPTTLSKAISRFLSKSETLDSISEIVTCAQDLFREHAWKLRCQHFALFEAAEGISHAAKTAKSSVSAPH